ncbi:MAG: serine hydrolase [Terriglobia bacterium]
MRKPLSFSAFGGLALVLAASSTLRAQQTLQTALRAKLETQMGNVAERLNGVMGYAIKDLSSGETFLRLPDTVFPQASSIKLTVLLELMRQAQEGKLSLDERHTLRRSEMTVGDTEPILTMLGDGTVTLSLRDLAIFMVVLSDNTATNILIDRLGMDNINEGVMRLGLKETKLRRHMIDLEAARKGNENVSTPREMLTLIEKVHSGEVIDAAHTKEYFDLLRLPKESEFHKALPEDVSIADKPGALEGVRCDTGLIDIPGHPFIMSITTTYNASDDEGERAIQDVARLVYDYFNRLSRSSSYGRVISVK